MLNQRLKLLTQVTADRLLDDNKLNVLNKCDKVLLDKKDINDLIFKT